MPVTRTIVLAAIALAGAPAGALAQAPPGPPGPPPGNGTDLPAPPGTAPAFVPAGTPATIPGGATGPGLLTSGDVALNRAKRTLSIRFACQGNGSIRITALNARGSYRCANGRATAKLKLSKKVAARAAKRRVTPATATLRQGARTQRVAFTLRAGGKAAKAKGFWTDGRLQCAQDGAPAYLVQPDFTTASATPISTRGWIAWYTAAGGWHWLGVNGENAGRWDTWTANVAGIEQFHPGGATFPIPYTWGPITVPTGQATYTVGVYEIVYWAGGRPDHQWQYVNAGTTGAAAAGTGSHYCVTA